MKMLKHFKSLANFLAVDRSYAFVEFDEPEDAKEAMENMNYSILCDRCIRVSPANFALSAEETAVPDIGKKNSC